MLYLPGSTVGKIDFQCSFFLARAGQISTFRTWISLFLTGARVLTTYRARFSSRFADTRGFAAFGTWIRLRFLFAGARVFTAFATNWKTIPGWVGKFLISLNKIKYREIEFTIEATGTTSNYLFKLNHRIDWAEQNDITHIECINTR